MAIEILMPALSPTMTEGTLARWLKKEGDKIKPGEVIAEIETDKAVMEVEAVDSGILGKILIPDKSEAIKVNSLIGVLLETGEDASAIEALIANFKTPISAIKDKEIETKFSAINKTPTTAEASTTRIFASPLAKRIASQEGISLNQIQGTGPHGRIVKKDVLAAKGTVIQQDSGRSTQEYTIEPLSQMRKTIAKRLLEAKQTVPHFYLTIDCSLEQLSLLREQINIKLAAQNIKISVNDLLTKATAMAIAQVPKINASYSDEGILYYNNIDISIAVAIAEGLITPILKNADQKNLQQISSEIKKLAEKAKEGALKPEEFVGGGFTITNLGMYGIKTFNAIINPPQSAILAIGAAEQRPYVTKDGQLKVQPMLTLSLSCDHRVVDGALAAQFLQQLKQLIETPGLMLI